MVRCEFRKEHEICPKCSNQIKTKSWTYTYKTTNASPDDSNFVFGLCLDETDELKINEKALVQTTSAHNMTYYSDKIANLSGKQKILSTYLPILTAHQQTKEIYEQLQKKLLQVRYTEASLMFNKLHKDEGFAVTQAWITDVNGDEWKEFEDGMKSWFETCGDFADNEVTQVGRTGPKNHVYCWGKIEQDVTPEAIELSNRFLIPIKLKPENLQVGMFKPDVH